MDEYSEQKEMYFQKQGMFTNTCAIHAVNNLIGCQAFYSKSFNQICTQLEKQAKMIGYTSRSKHILGGDYDVNVILKALQNCGLEATWVDSRTIYKYRHKNGTLPKGYIINRESEENVFQKLFAYSGRHWVCVKLEGCDFYLIDSKKEQPQLVVDIEHFINQLRLQSGNQILQVKAKLSEEQKSIVDNNQKPLIQGILQVKSENEENMTEKITQNYKDEDEDKDPNVEFYDVREEEQCENEIKNIQSDKQEITQKLQQIISESEFSDV